MRVYQQRLLAVGMALAGSWGVLPTPSASANPADVAAIEFNCSETLISGFPGTGGGTCTGPWTGVVVDGGTVYTGGVIQLSFSYSEPCPPLTGTASGLWKLWSGPTLVTQEYFDWLRVGPNLTIQVSDPLGSVDGVGSGTFAPNPPPPPSAFVPPCTPKSTPQYATVVAAAAWG